MAVGEVKAVFPPIAAQVLDENGNGDMWGTTMVLAPALPVGIHWLRNAGRNAKVKVDVGERGWTRLLDGVVVVGDALIYGDIRGAYDDHDAASLPWEVLYAKFLDDEGYRKEELQKFEDMHDAGSAQPPALTEDDQYVAEALRKACKHLYDTEEDTTMMGENSRNVDTTTGHLHCNPH